MQKEMTSCSIDKKTLKTLNVFKIIYGIKSHSEAIEKAIYAYEYLRLNHPEVEL